MNAAFGQCVRLLLSEITSVSLYHEVGMVFLSHQRATLQGFALLDA